MKQTEKEFAALVKEQKSTIYSICYMFSKDKDEVDDLFQETLIHPDHLAGHTLITCLVMH